MFKTKNTPEKIILVKSFFPNKTFSNNLEYLAFSPKGKRYGWISGDSINGREFITINKINQDALTQLILLHSIGFTPKEIAEIPNE